MKNRLAIFMLLAAITTTAFAQAYRGGYRDGNYRGNGYRDGRSDYRDRGYGRGYRRDYAYGPGVDIGFGEPFDYDYGPYGDGYYYDRPYGYPVGPVGAALNTAEYAAEVPLDIAAGIFGRRG